MCSRLSNTLADCMFVVLCLNNYQAAFKTHVLQSDGTTMMDKTAIVGNYIRKKNIDKPNGQLDARISDSVPDSIAVLSLACNV